jgi:TonB family protein
MTKRILMSAAALALHAGTASAPAGAARIVAPAQPRGDPQSLISGKDYPASALRKGEQGTVRYALEIGADGRVRGCRVIRSSGSSSLDSAACRIMTARRRFRPAIDSQGNPAPSQEVQAVAWSLPAEAKVVHWGYGMVSNSSPPPMAIVTNSSPILAAPIMAIPQHGPGEAELSVWTPGSTRIPTLGRFESIPDCRRAMARLKLSGGQKAYCTIAPENHSVPRVH